MRLLPMHEESDLYKTMKKDENSFIDTIHQTFLIEHEKSIIGFTDFELEEECFPDEDLPEICLKVHNFYIMPEFRGKSFGTQAFKLLRQWGRENEAALIEISVKKDNECSHQFLQEQGLELVGSGPKDVFRGFI
ncbi:MAG: GNAT family N-acetyltransferase [Verrucomicrobia bacterium]|nr:GNAT family N-acetyltransferase [Verrucomicrobiota bacterium]MBS0637807.1 GNAT family N-acetyltransferase [Verrucomicrobiota bacterium]